MSEQHDDPFCWDGAAAPAGAEPPASTTSPARRARRPRAWLGALVAVCVGGAIAAALVLNGGGGAPQAVLARVADVTNHVPGYRFTMALNVSAAGQNIVMNANGRFNTQPLNGTMTLDVAGHQVTEDVVAPYAYLQIPSVSSTWQRIALGALGSSSSAFDVDIQQTIGFLRTVGTVTTVGPDVIDTVPTTHYHAVIDVSRLAAALPLAQGSSSAAGLSALEQALGGGGLPLDVWVDAQSRVRQLTLSMQAEGATFSLTMQLSDYGPQAPVTAPSGPVNDLGSAPAAGLAD